MPKIKGNLTLILEGEYTMISLTYKVRDDVVILPQVMVNLNMALTQYNSEDNALVLMETPTVIQIYNV